MNRAAEHDHGLAALDAALTEANLAPLSAYLHDPDVYEIRINKFGQVVCVTSNERRLIVDEAITHDYLYALTDYLLNLNGLPRTPVSYVTLPGGERGTFCWPPAVLEGTVLVAIRKHLPVSKSLRQLKTEGRFKKTKFRKQSEQLALEPFEQQLLALCEAGDVEGFLSLAVKTKRNVAIAGPTGSGKTALTRSLMDEVPTGDRVMLLQDTHEIDDARLDEVGYLMYGAEADGRMSPRDCLKLCMRLSPDRIFLAELRDDAAWDYLASANTGHPGGIFSTHADSAASTPARIATLVKASEIGRALDYEVIMKTITTTLDVVVYMENREVLEILYDPVAKKKAMAF